MASVWEASFGHVEITSMKHASEAVEQTDGHMSLKFKRNKVMRWYEVSTQKTKKRRWPRTELWDSWALTGKRLGGRTSKDRNGITRDVGPKAEEQVMLAANWRKQMTQEEGVNCVTGSWSIKEYEGWELASELSLRKSHQELFSFPREMGRRGLPIFFVIDSRLFFFFHVR